MGCATGVHEGAEDTGGGAAPLAVEWSGGSLSRGTCGPPGMGPSKAWLLSTSHTRVWPHFILTSVLEAGQAVRTVTILQGRGQSVPRQCVLLQVSPSVKVAGFTKAPTGPVG